MVTFAYYGFALVCGSLILCPNFIPLHVLQKTLITSFLKHISNSFIYYLEIYPCGNKTSLPGEIHFMVD